MVSDSRKQAVNVPQKTFFLNRKKTQNIKLSAIFGGFQGLNYPPYQMNEATIQLYA